MAMDATLQVRMDGQLKSEVEELYRSLGTSFAEAVRMFAQQSLKAGGMPFRPSLRTWEDMSAEEVRAELAASEEDIQAGRVYSPEQVEAWIGEMFPHG